MLNARIDGERAIIRRSCARHSKVYALVTLSETRRYGVWLVSGGGWVFGPVGRYKQAWAYWARFIVGCDNPEQE